MAKTATMIMYGANASMRSRRVSVSWSRSRTLRSSAGLWPSAPATAGVGPVSVSASSGSPGDHTRRKPTSTPVENSAAMMSVSSTEM